MTDENDGLVIPVSADTDDASMQHAADQIRKLGEYSAAQEVKSSKATQDAVVKKIAAIEAEAKARGKSFEQYLYETNKQEQAQKDQLALQQKAAEQEKRISEDRIRLFERVGRVAGEVGRVAMIAGTAVLTAMVADAQKFASTAAKTDQVAQRWTSSMKQIDDANKQVGRGMAEQLNPQLETLAKYMTQFTAWAADNKQAFAWLEGGGIALLAGGAILNVLGMLARLGPVFLAAQKLAGAGGAGGAVANAIGYGAPGGIIGPAAAPSALAAAIPEIAVIAAAVLGTAAVAAAIGLAVHGIIIDASGKATKVPDAINPLKNNPLFANPFGVNPITGTPNPAGPGSGMYGPPKPRPTDNDLQSRHPDGVPTPDINSITAAENAAAAARLAIIQKNETDLNAAIAKGVAERLALVTSTEAKMVAATKTYEDQRAQLEKQMSDLTIANALADKQALEDYNKQRKQLVAAEAVTEQRAKEDHLRALQQIQDDSDLRIQDLALNRDALGIALEKRAAQKAKDDENSKYDLEKQRREQDNRLRLNEMDQQYRLEKSRRDQAYQYNMAMLTQEVKTAYDMWQAIITASNTYIAYLRQQLGVLPGPKPAPNPSANFGSSNYINPTTMNYSAAANGNMAPAPPSSNGGTMNVSVSGGGLTVSQTREIARSTAEATTVNLLRQALA